MKKISLIFILTLFVSQLTENIALSIERNSALSCKSLDLNGEWSGGSFIQISQLGCAEINLTNKKYNQSYSVTLDGKERDLPTNLFSYFENRFRGRSAKYIRYTAKIETDPSGTFVRLGFKAQVDFPHYQLKDVILSGSGLVSVKKNPIKMADCEDGDPIPRLLHLWIGQIKITQINGHGVTVSDQKKIAKILKYMRSDFKGQVENFSISETYEEIR